MKKILALMILIFYSKELCALALELKNLSVSLIELQKTLTLPVESSGALNTALTNQKTALTASLADLKSILKKIIDPHRVFSSEQERKLFYYFILEESLNSAKVMELLAQKKFLSSDLDAWYKQEKLPEMTQGVLSQLAYKQYLNRDEWRPLPSVPGQEKVKSSFEEARELKEKLLEVMQNIITQNETLPLVQNKQTFKAIFDEALKDAMAEWYAAKKNI